MNNWTNFKQIETWFLEKADYQSGEIIRKPDESVQKGDQYTWKWNNWDFTEEGQILEANGKDLLSFTFGAACRMLKRLDILDGKSESIFRAWHYTSC